MPLPAVTLRRNGTTSSGLLGPPNEYSSSASYGRRSGAGPGSTALAGVAAGSTGSSGSAARPVSAVTSWGENGGMLPIMAPAPEPARPEAGTSDVTLTGQSVTSSLARPVAP